MLTIQGVLYSLSGNKTSFRPWKVLPDLCLSKLAEYPRGNFVTETGGGCRWYWGCIQRWREQSEISKISLSEQVPKDFTEVTGWGSPYPLLSPMNLEDRFQQPRSGRVLKIEVRIMSPNPVLDAVTEQKQDELLKRIMSPRDRETQSSWGVWLGGSLKWFLEPEFK